MRLLRRFVLACAGRRRSAGWHRFALFDVGTLQPAPVSRFTPDEASPSIRQPASVYRSMLPDACMYRLIPFCRLTLANAHLTRPGPRNPVRRPPAPAPARSLGQPHGGWGSHPTAGGQEGRPRGLPNRTRLAPPPPAGGEGKPQQVRTSTSRALTTVIRVLARRGMGLPLVAVGFRADPSGSHRF